MMHAAEAIGDRAGWHELLLALAGRIGDQPMATARAAALSGGGPDRVAAVVAGAEEAGTRLLAEEVLALVEAVVEVALPGDAEGVASMLDGRGDLLLPDFTFRPWTADDVTKSLTPELEDWEEDVSFDPGAVDPQGGSDGVLLAAVAAARATPGVVGLWAVWRCDPVSLRGAPDPREHRVFLVETSGESSPASVAASLQDRLAAVGESPARVEVFGPGARLPSYQRAALGGATLVWVPQAQREIEMVPVFDGMDAQREGWFDPRHPRLTAIEQAGVVAYLAGAESLVQTTAALPDVVDPAREAQVPLGFRTDGRYTWCEAVAYYADQHALAPWPPLLAAIRAAQYEPPRLDRATLFRAESAFWKEAPG